MASEFTSGNIAAPSQLRSYPSYADLAQRAPYRHLRLYAAAPWHNPNALEEAGLIDRYLVANRLPDGLPFEAIQSREWRYRCYIPDNQVWAGAGRRQLSQQAARERLVRSVYQRVERMGVIPVEPGLAFDTWVFRTADEAQYGPALATVVETSEAWAGETKPKAAALAINFRLLPEGYKSTERFGPRASETDYYRRLLKYERHQRARTGYLVPYQALEVQYIRQRALAGRHVALPRSWSEWEVPKGLHVELPPVLTYAWRHLLDRAHDGLWCVFYTEWSAFVAAAFVWEAYATCRLFWLPSRLLAAIRDVDLSAALGSEALSKARRLVGLVEAQDWASVDSANKLAPEASGRNASYVTTQRADSGGDWVYLDPEAEVVLPENEARARRTARIASDGSHDVPMPPVASVPVNTDEVVTAAVGSKRNAPEGEDAESACMSVMNYEEESINAPPSEQPVGTVAPGGNVIQKVARVANTGSVREADHCSRSSASSVTRHIGQLDLARGLRYSVGHTSSGNSGPQATGGVPVSAPPSASIDTDAGRLEFLNSVLRNTGLIGDKPCSTLQEAMGLMANLGSTRGAGDPTSAPVGSSTTLPSGDTVAPPAPTATTAPPGGSVDTPVGDSVAAPSGTVGPDPKSAGLPAAAPAGDSAPGGSSQPPPPSRE